VKKTKRKLKEPDKAAAEGPGTAGRQEYRMMTVALIREPEGVDMVEVAFSESARFYRLLRTHSEFERIFRELLRAKENRQPIRVSMESPQSDLIADVKP
jgi:hypothetical protein